MLAQNNHIETVTVTFGRFVEQYTLVASHFHIEMHKTHATWGVNASLQRCDAIE